MNSTMGSPIILLANVEKNQKFDEAIVHRLAKVIEVLSNLED